MLLIGLDAASSFKKFGYAIGSYEDGLVRIAQAGLVETKDEQNALFSEVIPKLRQASRALIAIDAPLGWPAPLASELFTHKAGEALLPGKEALFRRETDRYVRSAIGKLPLEIGADKIARAAHTALEVLKLLREKCEKEIPLAWTLDFQGIAAIEVYPAGTLKARKLPDSGYKKSDQLSVRHDIARGFVNDIDGLDLHADKEADVFDACLCLAAAKDFLDGLAALPVDMDLAKKEGWIWVRNPTEKCD